MEINEYILSSLNFVIITLLIILVFSDYSWIFVLIMYATNTILRLKQVDLKDPKLKSNRSVTGRTFQEAERIKVTLSITNQSEYTFRGEIADELPTSSLIWEGTNVLLVKLLPNETLVFTYIFSFPRRGKYKIGPIHVRYHSLGENYERSWVIDNIFKFVIVPTPENVSTYSIPPSFLTSMGGPFKSKLVGDGIDFTGVRAYQPGDTYKRINWKQTAKLGKLHSNEFEINRPTDVIMVLDLTEESIDIADSSVRAALGLIDYLTHARCKVGLITLGKFIHYISPKTGKRHLLEISEHLTNVKSIRRIENLDLFQQRINETISRISKTKNEILLFSSLNRIENAILLSEVLTKIGKVTVLSPSETIVPMPGYELLDFTSKLLKQRKNVINLYLRRKDIRIYEWAPELPFEVSISKWGSKH